MQNRKIPANSLHIEGIAMTITKLLIAQKRVIGISSVGKLTFGSRRQIVLLCSLRTIREKQFAQIVGKWQSCLIIGQNKSTCTNADRVLQLCERCENTFQIQIVGNNLRRNLLCLLRTKTTSKLTQPT